MLTEAATPAGLRALWQRLPEPLPRVWLHDDLTRVFRAEDRAARYT